MPVFTIIKNGELATVVTKRAREIDGELISASDLLKQEIQEDEYFIAGAYSRSNYKLIDGKPVELEPSERAPLHNAPTPEKIMMNLAKEVKKAGIATSMIIESDFESWSQEDALEAIHQAAGRARARNIATGYLIEQEYQRLVVLVERWVNQGRAHLNVPNMLQSYATHSMQSVDVAADSIMSKSHAYDDLLAVIYDKRHEAAAAVKAATSDYYNVVAPFIRQLESI